MLPLTFTRPVSELRIGILTIGEKWERMLGTASTPLTREYLREKYPVEPGDDNLLINSSLLPDRQVTEAIGKLKRGESLVQGAKLIAARAGDAAVEMRSSSDPGLSQWIRKGIPYEQELSWVDFPWKVFMLNGQEIEADFHLLTRDRESAKLDQTVQVIGDGTVFVEEGFSGQAITLSTHNGPIYLGRDSEIMEGSVIRGPFALCEGAIVKMAAKIYGPTTLGPYSKAGGEINNTVILANSNKTHDGFLGNSVLGEWCNLGADTNNSNLKNNYSETKMWNYPEGRFISTGRKFCGLIMGDHSKSGINTMFNTATLVGVSANIFGPGFPPAYIPSFSWGGSGGFSTYRLDKALETAGLMMERRSMQLTEAERRIMEHIFEETAGYRSDFQVK